ncbi:UNVERIFIED_CONTAM: hypothetical protein GTU68_017281 [Idotea baltica]|nr:hypothetical protein [Idotea baltica]
MFKSDNPTCMDDRPIGNCSNLRISSFEEPTRDPDVWPAPPPRASDWPQPTTADHRWLRAIFIICKYYLSCRCNTPSINSLSNFICFTYFLLFISL